MTTHHYEFTTLTDALRVQLITYQSVVDHHRQCYATCRCGALTSVIIDGWGPICDACFERDSAAVLAHMRGEELFR